MGRSPKPTAEFMELQNLYNARHTLGQRRRTDDVVAQIEHNDARIQDLSKQVYRGRPESEEPSEAS